MEGAGVKLHRGFGFGETNEFDPFLLFDDFRNERPDDYLAGFPWHPHRGIETITYVLAGTVDHGDSLGNRGSLGAGDVQWMTAGSGIIHQEMPQGDPQGVMQGFQLWANLPASQKMRDPRYRDVKARQIPIVRLDNGPEIKVICGRVGSVQGPVRDIVTDPEYLDISVPASATFKHPTKPGHTVLAYVISGRGYFDEQKEQLLGNENLVLFGEGDSVAVTTGDEPVRFLLLSGKPIGEPIAWYGPIVMNTQAELKTAFEEYRSGTFIKAPVH